MNQYLIEAWADPHDGRTRRHYIMAANDFRARERFMERFPERVIRNQWKLVHPAPTASETESDVDIPPQPKGSTPRD